MLTLILDKMKDVFISMYLLGLLFTSCNNKTDKNPEPISPEIFTNISKVKTIVAIDTVFNFIIQGNGKVVPNYLNKVVAEIGGKIAINKAFNGMVVLKYQLLAEMDRTSLELILEKAKEKKSNASLEYESKLLGYENLFQGKSKDEIDLIKKKLQTGAGVTSAEIEIKEAENELNKNFIRSPAAGILANVKIVSGQQLKPGDELYTVYSKDLNIEIKIPEDDIFFVHLGDKANVSALSSDLDYHATVSEINPIVDENGMILIKLKLQNSKNMLPGMNVNLTINIPQQKALMIPKEAVVMRNDRAVVFTLKDSISQWNYIKVGRDNGKDVEVLDGILTGEKVIVTNNVQLAHGTKVFEIKDSL